MTLVVCGRFCSRIEFEEFPFRFREREARFIERVFSSIFCSSSVDSSSRLLIDKGFDRCRLFKLVELFPDSIGFNVCSVSSKTDGTDPVCLLFPSLLGVEFSSFEIS